MTQKQSPSRRAVLHASAWTAPAVIFAQSVPAFASSSPNATSVDYGVFVSSSYQGGSPSSFGSMPSNSGPTTAPATPAASFQNGATWYEPDRRWNDSTNSPTATTSYWNGEGSFTPAGNGTGQAGNFSTLTGFWISAPTTQAGTGTGYMGSTTLKAGAVVTTTFKYTLTGSTLLYPRVAISGGFTTWDHAFTGSLAPIGAGQNPYLVDAQVAGDFVFSRPTTSTSGNLPSFEATVKFTTTQDLKVEANKFGQVVAMPSVIVYTGSYSKFAMTTVITSATLEYQVPAPYVAPRTTTLINAQQTTAAINP